MSWVATAIIGSSVVSGYLGNKAADKQASAANQSNQVQWDIYQQNRADQAPYREVGSVALSDLMRAQSGDLSGFYKSPTYTLGRENAERALNRMNSASGKSLSGSAILNNNRLGADLYGQYRNNLASMAGIGQTATNQTGAFGQNTANAVGNNMMAAGNARASAYGSMNNAVQGGIQNYMLYNYLNPSTNNAMFMNNAAGTGSYNSVASPF